MSKLVRRWIALIVFGLVMGTVCIVLGNWQLARLEQRRHENAILQANEAAQPRSYTQVMNKTITDQEQYQRVTATGTYLPQQFQVRLRSVEGVYGSEIVAVLHTEEGHYLLVDRGLVPRQGSRPDVDLPPVASGKVTITGYVRRNEHGLGGEGTPHENQIRLINSDDLAAALGKELVNGYVTLITATPSESEVLVAVPTPQLSEGNHLSYALQWFAFTIIGVVGIVVLVRGDLKDRKKAARRKQLAQEAAE